MKRYNQIGTLTAVIVAAVVLLAGCAKNDLTEPGRPQPPAGMGELTLGQLQLLGGETAAQSRAGASSNLPEGSTLRLYAFAEGETNFGSKLATRTYTINATGAAQLDAGQEPLFLPKGNADIYLVGPVEHNIGTQTDPVMVEVAAEWGIDPRIGADLIATYAKATIMAGNTNPLPSMTLEHKMARAQIVVEANPAAVYENLAVQEVKLYGQPTTGTFTLDQTGGVITADERLLEDFVCPSVAKDPMAEKYSATTVLLPQAEREFKIETTFECNQKNTEHGDNHPTLKYRQSGLITAPLAAGTATRFSTQPITPVEIKWRTKVLPWNEVQQDDITTGSELEYNIAIPPMADQYIEINGLKWVKGNLVAKNHFQCMVGEPTDGGLYFQYGSLIGWWGGADGSGVGTPNIKSNPTFQVKPFKFSGTPAYGSNYYTGSTTGVLTDLVADSHTTAIGDPCRYYLGSPWRLPTGEEMGLLCNNSLTVESRYDWGDATNSVDHTNKNPSGAWFNTTTPSSGEGLFFPAAGVYHETGYSSGKNQYGYYWSSSIHVDKPAEPRSLHFTLNGVYPQWYYPRTFALPVRCVSGTYTPPPPSDSYIPTYVLEAAGWPADKLPATGLQVAMRGGKQMPGSGTPGVDAQKHWKTEDTFTDGVERVDNSRDAQLGMGKANTDAMIAAGAVLHPAAQYCREMGPEWYLPCLKELLLIYDNKTLLGSDYTFASATYWSSSEDNGNRNYAWYISFGSGNTYNLNKSTARIVRCVREI